MLPFSNEVMNKMMEYILTTPNEQLNTGIVADGFLTVGDEMIYYRKPNGNCISLSVLRKFFPEIHTHLFQGELIEKTFDDWPDYKMYEAKKEGSYHFLFCMYKESFNTFDALRNTWRKVEALVSRIQKEEDERVLYFDTDSAIYTKSNSTSSKEEVEAERVEQNSEVEEEFERNATILHEHCYGVLAEAGIVLVKRYNKWCEDNPENVVNSRFWERQIELKKLHDKCKLAGQLSDEAKNLEVRSEFAKWKRAVSYYQEIEDADDKKEWARMFKAIRDFNDYDETFYHIFITTPSSGTWNFLEEFDEEYEQEA
jgi:hypothetical protein